MSRTIASILNQSESDPCRTPFLKQIAEIYASLPASENRDVCFIFPNKRSATFFAHFLKQCPSVPERFTTRTISEFAASFSKLRKAERLVKCWTMGHSPEAAG